MTLIYVTLQNDIYLRLRSSFSVKNISKLYLDGSEIEYCDEIISYYSFTVKEARYSCD